MDTKSYQKFCPVCHLSNDANAVICQHCKSPMNSEVSGAPTTRRVDMASELTDELIENISSNNPAPEEGLAFFLLNNGRTIDVCKYPEIVLGRVEDQSHEHTIDLTEFDAFTLGVSRRHALIRVSDGKYTIMDINSSNGTWLNGNRLLPNKQHDLPTKSVIQLGRLKLVVIYSRPPGPIQE